MENDREVISCLKFIGKIQKGDKINVKHMYVQQDGILTQFMRTFLSQDNRRCTLSFIRNNIKSIFEIIDENLLSDN